MFVISLACSFIKNVDTCNLKKGAILGLPLFYFRLFNTVDNKQVNEQMFSINFANDWSHTMDL